MTSYSYIIIVIVDSCMILFYFDCIMQLKKSYHFATNVCSRKSATTFGDLPDCKTHHEWPKNRYSRQRMYCLLFTHHFMSRRHNSAKSNYQSLIEPLSLRTIFSDLALWRHHSWSVTSRECGVLILWRHIRRLFLYAEIGAKAMFTSE